MKRIATAAVAATLSLSIVTAPAYAAEADTAPAKENQGSSAQAEGDQAAGEKVGSSEVYKKCKEGKKAESEQGKEATAGKDATTGKDGDKAKPGKEKSSNNATGECIQELIDNPDTKPGILGLLIGVPVALVALLGAAAAFSGAIPGVQLPALPGLPM